MTDLLADANAFIASRHERIQTHSERCHQWHPACMVARLAREVERLRLENTDYRREVREQRLEIAGLRDHIDRYSGDHAGSAAAPPSAASAGSLAHPNV